MSTGNTGKEAGQPLDRTSATWLDPVALRRAAGVATALLCLTNLVGYLDRAALALLVQPIKASLQLSDGEMGLMLGPAFIFAYSISGIFIGRIVDRTNRRNLLIMAAALWSLSTAAGGLAQNGTELFIARMGVGIGEASLFPVAVSMLSDYYEPERRGKPISIFILGAYCGNGLSLILTGALLPWAALLAIRLSSFGMSLEPWRVVLMVLIVPGLICCGVLTVVREPVRRQDTGLAPIKADVGFRDWIAGIAIYLPLHLFMSLVTLAQYAVTSWVPTVLIREYHISTAYTGLWSGGIIGITGLLCVSSAGVLSDRASRKGGPTAPLKLTLLTVALTLPGFALLAVSSGPVMLMTGVLLTLIPSSMALLAGLTALSNLSPARSRGRITAIHFLFTGILGVASGPAIVGYTNDLVGGAAAGRLGIVVSIVGLTAIVLATSLAWLTLWRTKHRPVAAMLQLGD